MKKYTVKSGQNIYDVAIQLHGTVEGIFDLLLCNSDLSMDTILTPGMEVQYNESFMLSESVCKWLNSNHTTVKNGHHTTPISDATRKRIIIHQQGVNSAIDITVKTGTVTLDWGDFSTPETLNEGEHGSLEHYYKSAGNHTIVISGDFTLTKLDFSALNGIYYVVEPLICKQFIGLNVPQLNTLITQY